MGPCNDILDNSCVKCKFNFSAGLSLIHSLQYSIIGDAGGKMVLRGHHHPNSEIPKIPEGFEGVCA